jgi:hypothetical protein
VLDERAGAVEAAPSPVSATIAAAPTADTPGMEVTKSVRSRSSRTPTTIRAHRDGIRLDLSSGKVEGRNAGIRLVARRAWGFHRRHGNAHTWPQHPAPAVREVTSPTPTTHLLQWPLKYGGGRRSPTLVGALSVRTAFIR